MVEATEGVEKNRKQEILAPLSSLFLVSDAVAQSLKWRLWMDEGINVDKQKWRMPRSCRPNKNQSRAGGYQMCKNCFSDMAWFIFKIPFVFKSLHNTYKIQRVPVNLRKRSNHSTFRCIGQFPYSAGTPMIVKIKRIFFSSYVKAILFSLTDGPFVMPTCALRCG